MTPNDLSRFRLSSVFSILSEFFAERPGLSRIPYIFFLACAFFLLIERYPADVWLSLCGLAFLMRSANLKDWSWAKPIGSGHCSDFGWSVNSRACCPIFRPIHRQALAWVRFPAFCHASVFWLAKDRRVFTAMILISLIGLMAMLGILTAKLRCPKHCHCGCHGLMMIWFQALFWPNSAYFPFGSA